MVLDRYYDWYNEKRRHGALKRQTPNHVFKKYNPVPFENKKTTKLSLENRPVYWGSRHIQEAIKVASHTEILVVIGYSFPIFNREIDRKLFDRMGSLKKVYIQDPNAEVIKSTMVNAFETFQQLSVIGQEKISFQIRKRENPIYYSL